MNVNRLVLLPLAFGATLAASARAEAAIIPVGPGDDFTVIEAAQPGDIVEIESGTYRFRLDLAAVGSPENPIVIRAVDPADPPVWDLGGMNVDDWPGSNTAGDNDRGCWQIRGSGYEISGIIVRNCGNAGGNAAGMRTVGSADITLRDIVFDSNDVGFSGDGENTLIEFSEFVNNGQQSSPPQHSIYVFGGSFHLRYSYLHDSAGGQNLHIRARDSVIEYNWIARAQNYEGDLSSGPDLAQTMVFRGNVVVGHPNPENGGRILILNGENGVGITMDLRVLWNTFYVQSGTNPALVQVVSESVESATVELSNNIVFGTDVAIALTDEGLGNTTVSGTNNWFSTGADVSTLQNTVFGDDPGFNDAAGLDFFLVADSPAVGNADANVPGSPNAEYFENETNPLMFRWRDATNDIGALELSTRGPGYGPYDDPTEPPTGDDGGTDDDGGPDDDGGTDGGGTAGGDGRAAGDGPGDDATSAGSAGTASVDGTGSAGAGSDDDDGGCGCSASRQLGGGWLLLLLTALVTSHRRRLLVR